MRVINNHFHDENENIGIVTFVPMPKGEVHFDNVREILQEFLQSKRMGFSEISRCRFGQAFVKMDSVLDLDTLIWRGPHRFDDISIVFQHHDEGLN